MCVTDGLSGGKMRRMESVLWSAVVEMLDQACRREEGGGEKGEWDGGLNKVAADPTGASMAPAVTSVNTQGI